MRAETTVTPPRVPEPTSTYPAPFVKPVFTPLTKGSSRTRLLRLTIRRIFSPSSRVISVSTTFRRKRSRRTLVARSTRSLTDVYWVGASNPMGFSYQGLVEAHLGCRPVHLLNERLLRARRGHRQGLRGVAADCKQQAIEQIVDRDALRSRAGP